MCQRPLQTITATRASVLMQSNAKSPTSSHTFSHREPTGDALPQPSSRPNRRPMEVYREREWPSGSVHWLFQTALT